MSASARAVITSSRSVASGPVAISSARAERPAGKPGLPTTLPGCFTATAV